MKAQTGSGDDVGLEDSSQRENQSDSRWQENQPIRANASSSSVASAYFNNKITIPEDQQVPPGGGERERERDREVKKIERKRMESDRERRLRQQREGELKRERK